MQADVEIMKGGVW